MCRRRRGKCCRRQTPIGLHQLQGRIDAQRAQPGVQRGDVGAHHRLHISVDHRGAGARIFLDLRQDLMADRDRNVRQRHAQTIRDGTLVRRIGVAVQQADRDALHLFRAQHLDRRIDAGEIERDRDAAVRAQLFGHLQPQAALHQRARLGPADVVQHRHAQVADLQDVAEATRRDQRRASALALQHRVRPDRRTVQHIGDARAVGEQLVQAGDDALAIVVRRRGDLARRDAPIVGDRHQIGERAADIDTDSHRHGRLP